MSDYIFSEGTGSPTDMTLAAQAYGSGVDDGVTGIYNIGFSFVFCGNTYTQFSLGSNGYMGLGGSLASTILSSSLSSTTWGVPVICGNSRDLHTGADGYVKYITTGLSPNRVLTAEWRVRDYPGSGQPTNTTFQIRLYETTNKFDIWYGPVSTAGGSVGAKNSVNNSYSSVNAGPPAFQSNSVAYTTVPPGGVDKVYTWSLCTITPTGNIAQGGTALMNDQDSLMKTISVQRGSSGAFQPFVVNGPGCGPQTLSFAITGANASDYSISPASGSISSSTPITPTVTFTPTALGKRVATLTLTAPGYTRVYYLAATASPRIKWTPSLPQGGTPLLTSGDTLLQNISIPRHTSINVTPITLQNINANGAAPAAQITYTIKGSSGGQYTISPPTGALLAGQSQTPVITFNANGIGWIQDTLTVNADGEIRVFGLRAFSQAPGIVMRVNSEIVDTNSALFRNAYGCIGEGTVTLRVEVTNIGNLPLFIRGVDFFKLDTAYRQGIPRYPLVRDAQGKLVRSYDYIVTDAPPIVPLTKNNPGFPIRVEGSQTRTVFLTFIAQDRDKRFVRAYFRTNGENAETVDTNGVVTTGLIWVDLYARGVGSRLTNDSFSTVMKSVNFPPTRLGESSDMKVPLYNPGECQLRVAIKSVTPVSGDVDEFSVVSMPSKRLDAVTGDVLLAPGEYDTMVVRFTPLQTGSRRASLRLLTNDSTRVVSGITEKGTYYVDLFGTGRTGLYGKNLDFGTVLIGGDATEQHTGTIRLDNNTSSPMMITKITLGGTDAADFKQDPANPWPAVPYRLEAGSALDLGVIFAPQALPTGPRTATIVAESDMGDIITSNLTGTAGTRTIVVNPTAVNFSVSGGKFFRRTITVTNTGTMPLTVNNVSVAPVGTPFTVGQLARKVLDPGASEYLEVTYMPTAGSAGADDAQLTIANNSSTGQASVALHGVAFKAKQVDVNPSQSTFSGAKGDVNTIGKIETGEELSLSGVTGVAVAEGMQLWQSAPNPARDQVEIRYNLNKGTTVSLELYDAAGRLVKVLDAGQRAMGEQRVMVDVRELSNGVYHYRLTANGTSISKSMTVAR